MPTAHRVHELVHDEDATCSHPSNFNRTICIALDDTRQAHNAVTWAIENIIKFNDQVVVLHVRSEAIPLEAPYAPAAYYAELFCENRSNISPA